MSNGKFLLQPSDFYTVRRAGGYQSGDGEYWGRDFRMLGCGAKVIEGLAAGVGDGIQG